MSNVEWDHVTVIGKKPVASGVLKTESAVNAARRTGTEVSTEKKFSAGSNRQVSTSKDTAKLDRETEELHHDRVGIEVGRIIQQARMEMKLTQKELAQRINEQSTTVSEYESGRAIPNQTILGKLERVLGVRLRGAHKGEKFGGPKKKETAA